MTKKRFFSITFIFVLFLAPVALLRAEDGSSQDSQKSEMQDVRYKVWQARHDQAVRNMKEQRDEWSRAREAWQNSRPENRWQMRQDLAKVFYGRFKFLTDGLQGMHDRIEKWTDKMVEEHGVNDDDARASLKTAQEKIDLIKEKVADVKEILEGDINESEREAKRSEAKKILEEIRPLVKEAHESLKEAFRSIKSQLKEAKENNDKDN